MILQPVNEYSGNIGGVDLADQLASYLLPCRSAPSALVALHLLVCDADILSERFRHQQAYQQATTPPPLDRDTWTSI